MNLAPGSFRPLTDRYGELRVTAARLPTDAFVVVDAQVAKLHPALMQAIGARRPLAVRTLAAGEGTKSMAVLQRLLTQLRVLPRSGTLVAVGGGTIGDLCTVAAHLHKRGVRLVHVPTTLLAAVDSSVGGKGAVNVGQGASAVKNAAGVFHYPEQSLICPELFSTLSPAQRREGIIEAFKMAVCLHPASFRAWSRATPEVVALVKRARRLKAEVCRDDPYEQRGIRQVLNFGHTFGHVLESLSRFKLHHGEAVGLGMLCALDVGVALGVTPPTLAAQVEATLREKAEVADRAVLARWLAKGSAGQVAELLAADKKNERPGQIRMVLLRDVGRWELVDVPRTTWMDALGRWREGAR